MGVKPRARMKEHLERSRMEGAPVSGRTFHSARKFDQDISSRSRVFDMRFVVV